MSRVAVGVRDGRTIWREEEPARAHIPGHRFGAISGWWLTSEGLEDRARVEREQVEKARRAAK